MSRRSTGTARRSRSAESTWVFSSASEGRRGSDNQASTTSIHCSAGSFDTHASKWSVGIQWGDSSWSSATSPAACATSMVRAVRAQSECRRPRAAANSRRDSPPLRRIPGGWTDQSSSRSRTRASASRACSAASASTSGTSRWTPSPALGRGHAGTVAAATRSRTGWTARSRSGPPQTRARSTTSPRAWRQSAVASGGSGAAAAETISSAAQASSAVSSAAMRRTCRCIASSSSRQRATDGAAVARAVSAVKSVGTGCRRSGRRRRSSDMAASSRCRRSSARLRGSDILPTLRARRPSLTACVGRGRRWPVPRTRRPDPRRSAWTGTT